MTDFTPLDNPIWNALTTEHQALAESEGLARRYPSDVSPLAGMAEYTPAAFADLAKIVAPQRTVALFTTKPIAVPSGWHVKLARRIEQMVCTRPADYSPTPMVPLREADVPEMLELTAATKPGPFLPNTIRMGSYFGIRSADGGRKLASMAGERLRLTRFTEVSAVCTSPAFRGRGYSRTLVGSLAAEILRSGRTPFLHVKTENQARLLYEKIGFQVRCGIAFTLITRL